MPAATRHTFTFEGGEQLTTIGATFFVSYLYCRHVDSGHRNWEEIGTKISRIRTIDSSERYHRLWLLRVDGMSEARLSRNSLGLDGAKTKAMARSLLSALE